MTKKADQNRLRSIADRTTFPVEIGTLDSRDLIVILESLQASRRAYGRHPRADVIGVLGERLLQLGFESMPKPPADDEVEDAPIVDGEAVEVDA